MKKTTFSVIVGVMNVTAAWAQCAPGIPAAGNPGCIPPSAPSSPYAPQNQGSPDIARSTPTWVDSWAAIALDEKSGRAGNVENKDSQSDAGTVAMDYCERNGGRNCKVVVSYYNQCAAVAQNSLRGGLHFRTAAQRADAEDQAIADCGGKTECSIVLSKCSYARRVD